MNNIKKKRLGRGLEALLSASSPAASEAPARPVGNLADSLKTPGTSDQSTASQTAASQQVAAAINTSSVKPTSPATTMEHTGEDTGAGQSMASRLAAKAMAPASASSGDASRSTPPASGLTNPSVANSGANADSNTRSDLQKAGGLYAAAATSNVPAANSGNSDSGTKASDFGGLERERAILQVNDSGLSLDDEEGISDIHRLNVFDIEDNPFQPRRVFSESEIASLSESLKEHDMLQPILVRRIGQRFQLISGERRLRAAIQAGWNTIPARIRVADDRLVAELAIVENLQRKDLNALEKALSFRRYLDEHHSTQEVLAARLKIDRSTIANLMRLLELPQVIQDNVSSGSVTAGHARALLPLGEEREQISFCNRIIKEGWNVRETERRVSEFIADQDGVVAKPKRKSVNPQIESLETRARMSLGTKVEIKSSPKGAGKMIVHFKNDKEFQRIFEQICQEKGLLSKVA